jgi:hypothetical protein
MLSLLLMVGVILSLTMVYATSSGTLVFHMSYDQALKPEYVEAVDRAYIGMLEDGPYRAVLMNGREELYTVSFDTSIFVTPRLSAECFKENRLECEQVFGERKTSWVTLEFPFVERADKIDVYHLDQYIFSYRLKQHNGFLISTTLMVAIALLILIIKKK